MKMTSKLGVRNCLTCDRPSKVVILENPHDCFYALTPAGELFGRRDGECQDDCRLGGWVPSLKVEKNS